MNYGKLLFFIFSTILYKASAQEKSEADLVAKLFYALQTNDTALYESLYANTDSLSSWVLQYADKGSESYQKMSYVQNNINAREDYDTIIRRTIRANLDTFLDKAAMLGVHWEETVFMKYELEKIRYGSGLMIEKIAPLRFLGFIFFRDNYTRRQYAFTVYNIIQVNGLWYGAELVNIFPATTKEEYYAARKKERKRILNGERITAAKDTTDEDDEDESVDADTRAANMKEIADRKYYKGKFDNEIDVELYVRYIKGTCKEGICSWDAIFRFGDQDEYVPMTVEKNAKGNWVFTEDLGVMELELESSEYTGIWIANDSKTSYTVQFKETALSTKRANAFDKAMNAMDVE